MSDQFVPGGHRLPVVLSGPETAPVARRRGFGRIVWSILGVLVIAAAAVGTHVAANLGYDDARAAFVDEETITSNRQDDLASEIDALVLESETAAGIAAADTGVLMPADSRAALDASIVEVDTATTDAEAAASADLPDAGEKPSWTWELFGETSRLQDDTEDVEESADEVDAQRQAISDAGTALEETAVDAVLSAASAADDFEAAHVNARNPEILTMRNAAEYATTSVTALDADAAARFADLEAAAAAMLETERAELEEKKGALHDSYVAIEKFARSLAPGVLLDFDWSPTVPGYDGPSNGGWTTWWYGDPGYSTIALSDYVAEEWPAAWTKALVAHEVGHAISVKCESMYDSSDQDTIEEWATAWAISMGYTDRNNGSAVYGSPSQAMIDAAAKCR
ncbi:hypothetical protein [Microbacterium tumbae]